ncbi:MAG: hypothetical protein ACJ8F7_22875 [Gemmataceae bacterium]
MRCDPLAGARQRILTTFGRKCRRDQQLIRRDPTSQRISGPTPDAEIVPASSLEAFSIFSPNRCPLTRADFDSGGSNRCAPRRRKEKLREHRAATLGPECTQVIFGAAVGEIISPACRESASHFDSLRGGRLAEQIDDPLPPTNGIDPKVRLHDTVKQLNRCQKKRLIRFRCVSNGEGIAWERYRAAQGGGR